MVKFNCQMIMYETRHTDTKDNVKCLRAVAHIPGANIKEFLEIILSLTETGANPPFELVWRVLGTKDPDQKLFSVSGMGFGQQPFEQRRASFFETSKEKPTEGQGELGQQTAKHWSEGTEVFSWKDRKWKGYRFTCERIFLVRASNLCEVVFPILS
jgi:hypothetical protein